MSTSNVPRLKNLLGDWDEILNPWFSTEQASTLVRTINIRRTTPRVVVYPEKNDVFNAFKFCPPDKVKVVIIGQDPYYQSLDGKPIADGLAFSSNIQGHVPKSLSVIFTELDREYTCFPPYESVANTSLRRWAEQGVLLLNNALTVEYKHPLSHNELGWNTLIEYTIQHYLRKVPGMVYLLWGKSALYYEQFANRSPSALILKAAHPSINEYDSFPTSEFDNSKSFLGCNHFKQTNDFLRSFNKQKIDWLGI